MKLSENERQSGNGDKEWVTISPPPLLIQRSHPALRVKHSWITLLYVCVQVGRINVSMLVSIHEHI